MSDLIKKYDYVVPIGYVCNVTSFLMQLHKRDAAYVFDRAGTSMWAVCELIQNDFDDFLNVANIAPMKLYENSKIDVLTDTKYYFRIALPLNATTEQIINHNKDKHRHKERFVNLINTVSNDKTVLFVRFEEPPQTAEGARIIHENYKEKFEQNELYYLIEFSECIKKKNPLINFKILFIHSDESVGNFACDNIVGIIMKNACDYKDPFVSTKVVDTCDYHHEFLAKHI